MGGVCFAFKNPAASLPPVPYSILCLCVLGCMLSTILNFCCWKIGAHIQNERHAPKAIRPGSFSLSFLTPREELSELPSIPALCSSIDTVSYSSSLDPEWESQRGCQKLKSLRFPHLPPPKLESQQVCLPPFNRRLVENIRFLSQRQRTDYYSQPLQ